MRRLRPHLHPLLLLVLCLPVFATAASIESLVMPGPVIEGHAEVEEECSSCHAPFSQHTQKSLCLDCHEDVAADMAQGKGFHGHDNRLESAACRSCHTEHKGRAADVVGLVPESFDHALTGFSLSGRHAALSCQDCHDPEEKFREAEPECASCHEADQPHKGNLGSDCASCHSVEDWRETTFDHQDASEFALLGGHEGLSCESCHAGQIYEDTQTECASCHALDDVHHGQRGDQCGDCHTEQSWSETQFDHAAETGFALTGSHSDLSCTACHLNNMTLKEPPTECAGCHSADDVHQGQRGTACGDCHTEKSWKVAFDHLDRTGFALLGNHAELTCNQCHLGSLTDELPTVCGECHEKDDPHAGTLETCETCHNEAGWNEGIRFDHEFTQFPLLGMHKLANCAQCHLSLDFHQADDLCVDCHQRDDVHSGSMGAACEDCHVPSGWPLWTFDHDERTDFALTGAHEELVCSACHEPGDDDALNVSQACVSCHLAEDIHNGGFGSRCDRCHTTKSFKDDAGFF